MDNDAPELMFPEVRIWPFRWMDRAFNWWAERSLRKEKVWPPERYLGWWTSGLLVVVLAAMFAAQLVSGWVSTLAWVVMGGAAGSSIAALGFGRRLVYQRGFSQARRSMYESWRDARIRGVDAERWIEEHEWFDIQRMYRPPR